MPREKRYYVAQASDYFRVRAASTANATVATLDAGQTLDGVTLVQGDRVLLKDQTTKTENGVYLINADGNAATRATDYAAGYNSSGTVVKVTEGTANAGESFLQYSEPGVVGTNALLFIPHPSNV